MVVFDVDIGIMTRRCHQLFCSTSLLWMGTINCVKLSLSTVQCAVAKLDNIEVFQHGKKFKEMPRFEPRAAGCEAQMLPLFYAVDVSSSG